MADIPPTVANHCAFKAGLIVAGVALILNAASDTLCYRSLSHFLMMALVKQIAPSGVDAAGGDRADDFTWYHQLVSSYCISWVSGKVVMTMRRRCLVT